MKSSTLFSLLLFSLFLSACTPLRVVRLEPDTEEITFRYGEKVVTDETAGTRVDVSYYDASPRFIVFNLEVENTGTEPFDFDPVSCLLVPDVGPVSQAIDPEIQLLSMDVKTIQDQKTTRALAWVGAGILVAGVAVDLSNGNSINDFDNGSFFAADLALTSTQNLAFSLIDVKAERDYVRNAVPFDDEIPVPANRFFWLDHALRITTVKPGQKVYGKIAFPRNDQATSFYFNVSVKGNEFKFPFNQQLFKP
ncbi:hypothetical protein [Neolewinella persica]|uniref:hypothetical protein n=1 Tax=Neolewinella persica TaxID=70998 RepID=UPI000361FB3C|nr:hypothetical protein [Neolewinella persica]